MTQHCSAMLREEARTRKRFFCMLRVRSAALSAREAASDLRQQEQRARIFSAARGDTVYPGAVRCAA